MPKPRRVAVMLQLDLPYKRHAGIFAGVQQYAQEQGWESFIDEYAAEACARIPRSRRPTTASSHARRRNWHGVPPGAGYRW